MNGQELSGAICAQDNIVKEVLNSCNKFTELFYYGVAHIPLIFRAGFQIGDEGCVRLLHKYRNGQSKFKEISREPDNYSFRLKGKPEYGNAESTEMLVTVATSFPVMSEDLSIFREMDLNCELQFKAEKKEMYGFDVIDSYATMNRLRIGILDQIRKTAINRKISRIHLVLATSSDFAFFLAQGFSTYHDPEVVTYQYERSSVEKYPWGISNKLPPNDAVVYHATHACADE